MGTLGAALRRAGGRLPCRSFRPWPFLAPFPGGKRNWAPGWGFQRGPRGRRRCGPGAACLAVVWAPEKHRWPWLTELFFRFEPAPLFDSDPGERGKRFLEPPPRCPPGQEELQDRGPVGTEHVLGAKIREAEPWKEFAGSGRLCNRTLQVKAWGRGLTRAPLSQLLSFQSRQGVGVGAFWGA